MSVEKALRYPITKEWRERVREALEREGRGSHARMCGEIGMPTSAFSELLGGVADTSPYVEAIHAYLKWSPPLPPSVVLDAGETVGGYMRMGRDDRTLLDTAYAALAGVHGEQARRALVELLRLCRSY